MLLFFASVRPMNTRELEADKEPLTVLHCEGENSIIVCLPFFIHHIQIIAIFFTN